MRAPPPRLSNSPAPRPGSTPARPSAAPATVLVVLAVIGTTASLLTRPAEPRHGQTALARAEAPEDIAGLSDERLDAVQRLEGQARTYAATTLGLTPDELIQLHAIQRRAARRAAREAEAEPHTSRASAAAALVATARAEFAELSRLLGPARATALRDLQAHALAVALTQESWRRRHPKEAEALTRRRQVLLSLPLDGARDQAARD